MPEYIFGKNALYEAITAKIPLKKVFISQNLKECKNLCSSIQKKSPGTSIETASEAGNRRNFKRCAFRRNMWAAW